jgi:hypothetical protein
MTDSRATSRQAYQTWIDDQIEEFKSTLSREELLAVADEAVRRLQTTSPDGQYALTEILLCDVVDALLYKRLSLPSYRQWERACRTDTASRPRVRTSHSLRAAS